MLKKTFKYINIIKQRYNSREREEVLYSEKYHLGKLSTYLSIIAVILVVAVFFALDYISSGNYLSRWFAWSAGAAIIFTALSAPNKIIITRNNLLLHGHVDLDQIPLDSILYVKKIENSEIKRFIPFFASYGFLGFYGYCFDLQQHEIVKLFASQRKNWIELRTQNDLDYIISVNNPDEFIKNFSNIR